MESLDLDYSRFLASLSAIGETVYIKNCLHVMIYVQKVVANFAFISQVSFLSTVNFIMDVHLYM